MNLDYIKKIKEELKQVYYKNQKKISGYQEKYNIIQKNGNNFKFDIVIGYTSISYFGFIILFIILGLSGLITSIPTSLIGFLPVVVSSIIGIIKTKNFYQKTNLIQKLKSFSSSKNQLERNMEMTKYLLKFEKLTRKNEIIDKVLSYLNQEEKVIKKERFQMPNNLEINYFNSSKEINKQLLDLEEKIKTNYQELDTIITKMVLSEKFSRCRSNYKILDTLTPGLLTSIGFLIMTFLPVMIFETMNLPVSYSNMALGIYFLVLFGGSSCHFKMLNDEKKTFKFFNDKLKNEKLSQKVEYSKESIIPFMLVNKISQISELEIELLAIKSKLDLINEKPEQDTFEQEKVKTKTIANSENYLSWVKTEEDVNQEMGPLLIKKMNHPKR